MHPADVVDLDEVFSSAIERSKLLRAEVATSRASRSSAPPRFSNGWRQLESRFNPHIQGSMVGSIGNDDYHSSVLERRPRVQDHYGVQSMRYKSKQDGPKADFHRVKSLDDAIKEAQQDIADARIVAAQTSQSLTSAIEVHNADDASDVEEVASAHRGTTPQSVGADFLKLPEAWGSPASDLAAGAAQLPRRELEGPSKPPPPNRYAPRRIATLQRCADAQASRFVPETQGASAVPSFSSWIRDDREAETLATLKELEALGQLLGDRGQALKRKRADHGVENARSSGVSFDAA